MRTILTMVNVLALALLLSVNLACDKKSTDSNDEEQEFVATTQDFKDYKNWTLKATETGPDPFLKTAHGVNDNFTRKIFFNATAKASNGEYPVGSMILKELTDDQGNVQGAFTVMVKRGGNFNPDGNGWEWFMVSTDFSTVITQGDNATAGDGNCASCHSAANVNNNGLDWVFTR
ncbi:cytochrome P460 family protein [Caldithrix abyssi]|uniref:Cytochrome P460 n=1 Tax=Caldithrix abyssi DSM 13497 TaxID=880073 RepID=H1XVV3_CALAY|nr:cytochrome P460 family protein [Caldithrix abyssi]APF20842.1 Cytochrome P460 [Caldithrix abyssi DSM 13497]EHO40680.1 hypothetical protein Calab_1048 [Caldithrix abyssi DSM 13497]